MSLRALCISIFGIFSHSSMQILSSSAKSDGEHWGTAVFRSRCRCSSGCKPLLFSSCPVFLAHCSVGTYMFTLNADWSRFSSISRLYLAPSMLTTTSGVQFLLLKSNPRARCYCHRILLQQSWAAFAMFQALCFGFRPTGSTLVSSNHNIFKTWLPSGHSLP